MPARNPPKLSAEDNDLLADCVSITQMLTNHLTEEQARRLKKFLLGVRPRKRHRPRSELEIFLPMIKAHITAGLSVGKSCREVGRIIREDPERLRRLFYSARRRR
jgi:hypothetical protein